MPERRSWPPVAQALVVLALGGAVLSLALQVREARGTIGLLDQRLRTLENERRAAKEGRAATHATVAERGPEGLLPPPAVPSDLPSGAAMAASAPPPGHIGTADVHVAPVALDEGLSAKMGDIEKHLGSAEKSALKDMLRDLKKEVDAEDEKKQREEFQDRVFGDIAKSCELGPQQKDLVSQALQERFNQVWKLNELQEQGKLTEEEWGRQVHDVRKRADDEIRALLSADQLMKFEEWKKRQYWYGLQDDHG